MADEKWHIYVALRKVLLEHGKETVELMKAILRDKGKGDSRIIKRIRPKVVDTIKGLNLEIEMPDYWVFLDKGRRPGKQPPLSVIKKWCSRKGIPKGAAFPIAKKIGKFGLKPTNFTMPFARGIPALDDKIEKTIKNALDIELEAFIKKNI